MKSELLGAIGWNIATKIVAAGFAFLSIPIFTRLLSTSDYGNYALYMSWLGILFPIISAGLHLSIARAKIEYANYYSSYVSSIVALVVLFFLIQVLLVFFFIEDIKALLSLNSSLIFILTLHSFFQAVILISLEYFRYKGRYKATAFFEILQPVLIIMVSVLMVIFSLTDSAYLNRVVGTVLPMALLSFILIFIIMKEGKVYYSSEYWKYGVCFSLPLIPGAIAFVMNAQLDKILISKFLGSHETGIYSFSYTIGMLVLLVGNAIKQAINPWIFKSLEEGEINNASYANLNFSKFVMLISLVSLYISPELVYYIAPHEYHSGLDVLHWIILGGFFQQLMSIEVTNVMFLKRSKWYSIVAVIGTLLNFGMNLYFIPIYGIKGAAITTFVSCLVMFSVMLLINRKVLRISTFNVKWYAFVISTTLLFFLIYILVKDNLILRVFMVLSLFLSFIFMYRVEIKSIINSKSLRV
ncbi:oligosaccharide flippase family protein [Vibrio splendidus]